MTRQAFANIPPPRLAQRHRPSGLNAVFQGEGLSFETYIAVTRAMLQTAHLRLGTPSLAEVVDGNAPFMRCPLQQDGKSKRYRRGILLTHGLTDSPYFMRHLADFFTAQGYLVMAILLPGHGTQAGDLLEVTWQEWAKAVAYGTERLAEQVDEVYLGGLSTGAALSIHQSLHDTRVRGLFLYAPALKISARAAYARLHRLYSWLLPKARWIAIQPNEDRYRYESFTMNGAAQIYALTQRIADTALHIPIFAVASMEDVTVDTQATIAWMDRCAHPANKLLVYSTAPPNARTGHGPITWSNSVFPAQRILGASHLSIVLPPEDEYYGVRGKYVNCSHYYPHEPEKYLACLHHSDEVMSGEITAANLRTGVLQRLMYNPAYREMCAAMQGFMGALAAAEQETS